MTPVCVRCKQREATHGALCVACRYSKPSKANVSSEVDGDVAFMAPGILSGTPMLHIPRFLTVERLEELLDLPDTVRTLSGQLARDVVREELLTRDVPIPRQRGR